MANPLPDVAHDVASFLATQGIGLTLGTNLFAIQEIAAATAPGVYCLASGGPAARPYLGTGNSRHRLGVQVVVRGEREKEKLGAILARQVADKLHLATITGYVGTYLRDAQPAALGRSLNDAPAWSVNVLCDFVS